MTPARTVRTEAPTPAPKRPPSAAPVRIGWSELVDLPDWHIRGLRAKIDTGARTSALHVDAIELLPRNHIRFQVVLHRHDHDRRVNVVARISRRARVRSSTGEYTVRYFVKTHLRLAGIEREVEISLVDRCDMTFRMLVGRTAVSGPFLVDPAHRNLGLRAQRAARRGSATHADKRTDKRAEKKIEKRADKRSEKRPVR